MPILDFREIAPPAKKSPEEYGGRLDDFEKFAQEFFRELYGAKFIRIASRGSDLGCDLLLDVLVDGSSERWLVSCKHKAHSGKAVYKVDEEDISDRFMTAKADRFIGFYSHIASNSLMDKLSGLEGNSNLNFKFTVFNSEKIETKLLSSSNGKGWFLASRFFPKSSRMLFNRILYAVEHYSESDVVDMGEGRFELPGPGGMAMCHGAGYERGELIGEVIKFANDTVTLTLNEIFLAKVIGEIVSDWPGCFSYWKACDVESMRISDVRPTFCAKDVSSVFERFGSGAAIIVCHMWSWWDHELALDSYREAFKESLGIDISEKNAWWNLSMKVALIHSDLSVRDKLIRLAAYVGTSLSQPCFWTRLAQTALFEGKDDLLRLELEKIYRAATRDEQREIRANPDSDTLLQLKEYSFILGADFLRCKLKVVIDSLENMEYRCFEDLIGEGIEWVVRPTERYDWFSNKVASNFSSKTDIVDSH